MSHLIKTEAKRLLRERQKERRQTVRRARRARRRHYRRCWWTRPFGHAEKFYTDTRCWVCVGCGRRRLAP